MLKIFSTLFKKKKWAYVKMISIQCHHKSKQGEVFIHLYESNFGNRRMEIGSTFSSILIGDIRRFVESDSIYHSKILRWLEGRPDPEIPTFNTVGEDDLANALKGTIG